MSADWSYVEINNTDIQQNVEKQKQSEGNSPIEIIMEAGNLV